MTTVIESTEVKRMAAGCGFTLCGITPAASLDGWRDHLRRWIESGRASLTAGYIGRTLDLRLDPRALLGGARSVIVCAVNYKNQAWDRPGDSPDLVKVASYALARDYHATVRDMLGQMLERLQGLWPGLRGRCFVDTGPVLEKELAVRAGIGWRGRNSLIVNRTYGSYMFLGEIVVDAVADAYDRPRGGDGCGNCRACVAACPTAAIGDDRTLDARRCISRATMYPAPGDPSTHGWAFGCELCQQCCPYNRKSPLHTDPRFDPVVDYRTLTRRSWESLDGDGFMSLFGETPLAFFAKTIKPPG